VTFVSLTLIALLQPGPVTPRYEQLENGLRVVVVEDHTLPLVSVQLWYRVGSAQDPPSRPGVCRCVRAMLEHRDDAALKLRAAGLRFESHTERDACYFSTVLPPDFLEYVLDIEAARMRPFNVSAEMVRQGVSAAARQSADEADDSDHIVTRQLLAAMFSDHPYRHPPEFVAESLKDLSVTEANESLERWFVPGNATLFVIGDVSTVQVLEQVRQRFGELEWAEPPRRAERSQPAREQIERWDVTEQRTGVDIAWVCPSKGYFENAAIDVLMHRLCNPVDGALFGRLLGQARESLRWQRHAWRDSGILVLSFDSSGIPPKPVETVEKVLAETAERVTSEIEHNRARALALQDARSHRAAFADRARDLAEHEIIAGDLLMADFLLPRLKHIDVADVQQAARLLQKTRRVVLYHDTPPAQDLARPPAPPAETLCSALETEPQARLDTGAGLQLLARHAAEAPEPRAPESPPPVVTRQLDSRTRVTVCRIPDSVVATVRTALPEIRKPEDILLWKLLRGSEQFDSDKLADYLSYRSVGVLPVPNSPEAALTSESPSEDAAQVMEIQASLILEPEWRGPGRQPRGMSRLLRYTNPDFWSARTIADGRSHGVPLVDHSRGLKLLRNLAAQLVELCRSPASVEVYVLGDMPVAEVLATAAQFWAKAAERATESPRPEPLGRPPRPGFWDRRHSSHRPSVHWAGGRAEPTIWSFDAQPIWVLPGSQQMHIRVTLRLWDESADDSTGLKADAVAWLLGHPPGFPRTIDGGHAWAWECRVCDANTVVISTETFSEHVTEQLAAILGRIKRVRSGDIPDVEVEAAIRLARATRAVLLDNQAVIAGVLQRGVQSPWNIDMPFGKQDLFPLVAEPSPDARLLIHVVGGREPPAGLEQIGDLGGRPPPGDSMMGPRPGGAP
jgi:zinc protease